jgi:hypothetical protein
MCDLQLASESFGFLTSRGMAAWAVAGVAAYVYFVVPKQREERDAMVRIAASASGAAGGVHMLAAALCYLATMPAEG